MNHNRSARASVIGPDPRAAPDRDGPTSAAAAASATRIRRRLTVRRRDLLIAACGTVASSRRAGAQSSPRIYGLLHTSLSGREQMVDAFKREFERLGYSHGRDLLVRIESANGSSEKLRELAAEFVADRPAVIVVWGGEALLAIQRLTTTQPVVIASIGDPLATGFVASMARPGGNVTGFSLNSSEAAPRRVGLARELIPSLARLCFLTDPDNPLLESQFKQIRDAAQASGVEARKVVIGTVNGFEHGFQEAANWHADAVITPTGPRFFNNRQLIGRLSLERRIALIASEPEYAHAGAVLSYGADIVDLARKAAGYAHRILKGENPAELPIQLPTKFVLFINLISARLLGVDVPLTLLAQASEVIE